MVKTRSMDKEKKEVKPPAKDIKKKTKTAKKSETPSKGKGKSKVASGEKKVLHESKMLEKGHIYFFYRPKVEHSDAHNADDVQKLYMVLRPQVEIGHPLGKNRLFILANKKLPEAKKHARYWAFVEHASDKIEDITKKLEPATYETKTQGTRHLAGCRPCGCGVYNIVHHLEGPYRSGQHTHLAYVLEVPEKPGVVQAAFNIKHEGSFILTVKNPTTNAGVGLSSSSRAEYPKELLEKFEGKKFSPAEPTSLLDYEGAELILIGASENIVAELGNVGRDLEETASEEEREMGEKEDHGCRLAEEEVFHAMHMHHKEHPAEPLLDGKWE